MPDIDYANINIGIQQFQDISTGELNAGEVRLRNENSLDMINNHAHKRGSNKTSLSHREVLAIKNAFVRSLSETGTIPTSEELQARVAPACGRTAAPAARRSTRSSPAAAPSTRTGGWRSSSRWSRGTWISTTTPPAACQRCAEAMDGWALEVIGERLGVPPASLDNNVLAVKAFDEMRTKLKEQIDQADIPPAAQDAFKSTVLALEKVKDVNVDVMVAAAKSVSGRHLLDLLDANAPAKACPPWGRRRPACGTAPGALTAIDCNRPKLETRRGPRKPPLSAFPCMGGGLQFVGRWCNLPARDV